MANNLSQLAPITTTATALSNLVLAIPQIFGNGPQFTIGYQPGLPPEQQSDNPTSIQLPLPPAFQFHYEGEQSVALQSDITDHYIEDNTAIQDQIALKPEIISTHGFIGELNDIPPAALKLLQTAASVLSPISAYVPSVSATALIAYNEAFELYQVAQNAANAAISAWSSLSGQGGEAIIVNGQLTNDGLVTQSKQQIAFQKFFGYWNNRVLFTVQTPWAVFQNCAINNLRAIQDSETSMITDFELSFKVIKTAETQNVSIVTERLIAQSAEQLDQGFQTPTSVAPQSYTSLGVTF